MKKKKAKTYVFSCIVAILIFSLYVNRGFIYAQIDKWNLAEKQQRLTELYFGDDLNVSKALSDEKKLSFSFVIHNLQGQATEFPYLVYFKSTDGQVTKLEENTVSVNDGEYKKIEKIYTSPDFGNKGTIFVILINRSQMIHFTLR